MPLETDTTFSFAPHFFSIQASTSSIDLNSSMLTPYFSSKYTVRRTRHTCHSGRLSLCSGYNQRISTQGICFFPSALHYQAAGLVENSRAPPDAGPAVPGTRSGHNLRYDLPSSGAPGSLQQPYRDPP